jgi:putative peptidoglycan binding protein
MMTFISPPVVNGLIKPRKRSSGLTIHPTDLVDFDPGDIILHRARPRLSVQQDFSVCSFKREECSMRRNWVLMLTLALLMTLVSADIASAKKSRSKGVSSRSGIKRDARRARPGRALSRREKRGRKTLAVRGKRGRRLARTRRRSRSRYQSQPIAAAGVPRPAPGIPAERITEIQNALIKAGYLDGPASGLYDDATIVAMKRFQSKNGLSQTGLPSATLLKKLGVPKRSNDGYAVPVNTVSEADRKRPGN